MKWVKKIQEKPNLGDRRVVRKFLFLKRDFKVGDEMHSYWLQFADVVEEFQQFMFERGDYINEPYEKWYENHWVEVGIKEKDERADTTISV